jgi:DNA-binding response OmpR family regulator
VGSLVNDRPEQIVRILVIEDERKLANALDEGLRRNGYKVVLADSGEAGIKQLRSSAVDLVLLDVMLPRQGGLETLREMRRSGFRIPVLLLTSKGLSTTVCVVSTQVPMTISSSPSPFPN